MEDLIQLANTIVADGKRILAADEITTTCTKRLESISLESIEVL